jgi:hypothetical protein
MKKLLVTLALLIGTNVQAQIPDGCYVTFNDPFNCWPQVGGVYTLTYFNSEFDNKYHYGELCGAFAWDANKCAQNFHAADNSYKVCEANRQEWIAYGEQVKVYIDKSTALIKKLRKKCGKVCKNVR